jgi:hypothetical protein
LYIEQDKHGWTVRLIRFDVSASCSLGRVAEEVSSLWFDSSSFSTTLNFQPGRLRSSKPRPASLTSANASVLSIHRAGTASNIAQLMSDDFTAFTNTARRLTTFGVEYEHQARRNVAIRSHPRPTLQ